MPDKAVDYFNDGYNCSQCIIKAAAETFAFDGSAICGACSGVCAGFGVGGMCGAVIACVMTAGLLRGEDAILAERADLLDSFACRFGCLDCCKLRYKFDCDDIIRFAAEMTEKISKG